MPQNDPMTPQRLCAFNRPVLKFAYDEDGRVYTNEITWRGEIIQVISNHTNGTTRELQRSDEIIQALLRAK